ncbi:uncharacterized protein A4U43_C08F26560 [Asparagus officinalis]|uniref:protein TIFY 10c-like isoform X2 n=1 Tax=Asparagus officinalis TaxID=4686 RepID=UPI00098E7E1A|nr:protein TIFY 10c-like isoform X2 [Asparagus officinalis]ONK61131.1 uncharacterized protein A4U43_C08F26560 [Asparagus officinalis]
MTSEKKSSFSVTCSRLSQFLKAKRSVEIPSSPQESTKGSFRPPTIMSLLPGADTLAETKTDTTENFTVTNQKSAKSMHLFPISFGPADNNNFTKELGKHQLTIFYKGKVVVFDNFPLEKAKDLMKMASTSALAEKLPGYCPQPVQQSPSG